VVAMFKEGNGGEASNYRPVRLTYQIIITRKPCCTRKPRDAAAVLFGLKFADNIQYKFKSSQASKARLQNSKHSTTKQNLTQYGHLRSLKVMCFGVNGKAIRDLSNTV